MKLVLDTNIFISAFYWGGNPQKIVNRIIDKLDELYISDEILNEITEVMARPKFKTNTEIINTYIKSIEKISKKVVLTGKIKGVCRDKDDDDKIECAVVSNADFIISGDDDLLILKNYQKIRIITIKEYIEMLQHQNGI